MQTLQSPLPIEIATIPEIQLIVCCARTHLDAALSNKVSVLIQQNLDWDFLLRVAKWHGVTPLLYHHLSITCPPTIPPEILHQLRTLFHANALNNELLTQELLNILDLFEKHGVAAIPLKGPVAAQMIYGEINLREFSDLDFLIHHQDLSTVKSLLSDQGYDYPRLQNTHGNECHFIKPGAGINLDIHWRVTPQFFRFPLRFKELRSRCRSTTLAAKPILGISPEDLVLILSAEWVRDCCHQRARLVQLCNLAELIRTHSTLDWLWILANARILGIERMLLLTLSITSTLLDVTLPDVILQAFKINGILDSLVTEASSYLWWQVITDFVRTEPMAGSFPVFGNKQQFLLKIRERLSDSLLYYTYCVLAPSNKEKALVHLPDFLSFLYLPIRLVRLTYKHGLQQVTQLKNR